MLMLGENQVPLRNFNIYRNFLTDSCKCSCFPKYRNTQLMLLLTDFLVDFMSMQIKSLSKKPSFCPKYWRLKQSTDCHDRMVKFQMPVVRVWGKYCAVLSCLSSALDDLRKSYSEVVVVIFQTLAVKPLSNKFWESVCTHATTLYKSYILFI